MRIVVVPRVICCKDRNKRNRSCFPSACGVRSDGCSRGAAGHGRLGWEQRPWGAENGHEQQDVASASQPCPARVVLGERR